MPFDASKSSWRSSHAPIPHPIHITFPSEDVEHMNELLRTSKLPSKPPFASAGWEIGVELAWLTRLKRQWEEQFVWKELEDKINRWPNFMVHFDEDIDLHFVHVRSPDENAIPLLLLHGWPGTFYDFYKLIEPLTKPETHGVPSFHVVIPSLPGYFKSSLPNRAHWTFVDTARVLNKLMVDVLGYDKYFGQGGDWGSYILRALISLPETSLNVPLAHFNMFRTPPAGPHYYTSMMKSLVPQFFSFIPGWKTMIDLVERTTNRVFLSPGEKRTLDRRNEFVRNGRGYSAIQATRPLTIGYALYASPLSLLAYIGEKMYAWSDPSAPGFDTQDIIDTVALYFLSESFPSSVLIYNQSKVPREEMITQPGVWKGASDCLVGFTNFPFEIGCDICLFDALLLTIEVPLEEEVLQGRTFQQSAISYFTESTLEKAHGGHFPALDNPTELLSDLREFCALYWVA